MTPTQVLLNSVAAAIAADTTVLAAALFLKVALVKAAFVPSAGLVVGDLNLADFATSTPLANTTAVILVFIDPQTGELIIEVPPPVGGWHWEVTNGVTNLPQTIYGVALLDSTSAIVYAAELLPAPLTINTLNQGIDIPNIRFRLSAAALS